MAETWQTTCTSVGIWAYSRGHGKDFGVSIIDQTTFETEVPPPGLLWLRLADIPELPPQMPIDIKRWHPRGDEQAFEVGIWFERNAGKVAEGIFMVTDATTSPKPRPDCQYAYGGPIPEVPGEDED